MDIEISLIDALLTEWAANRQLIHQIADAVIDLHVERSFATKRTMWQIVHMAFANKLFAVHAMHCIVHQLEAYFALERR